MREDMSSIELPPRSQLYSLAMQGTGDCDQESILDYAQRLSLEHGVRVRDMFSRVILPEAGIRGAFFIPGHFSAHAVRGCSGWSGYAQCFLAAMQRLTGRLNLNMGSMAAWGDVLSASGYVAKARRWCPLCLRSQQTRGFHTFSLVWAFEPVRVCPIHLVQLCERCGGCGGVQPVVGDRLAAGMCNRCGTRLAEAEPTNVDEVQHGTELYRARAVAGMIGLYRRAPSLVCSEHVGRRWQEVADAECGGSLFRLERHLQLSCGILKRTGKPSLNFFLEVIRRLGVEPATFLDGSCRAVPDLSASAVPSSAKRRPTAEDLSALSVRVAERLRDALDEQEKLTSRLELICGLGISNSFLGSNYPEVVRELRKHNDRIRPAVHRALWDRRRREIDAAMRSLVEGGELLTSIRIGKALVAIGLHRLHPKVRRIAFEALARAQQEVVSSQPERLPKEAQTCSKKT